MSSHRLNFTKAALSRAPNAAKGRKDYYYDEREAGLVMAVTPTGTKSFYLYKRIDGRPERLLLGRFPDISVENARKMAAAAKGKIASGNNPQKERRAIRAEMSFGDLFTLYLEKYAKVHKRSWAYDQREVNKFLSHWFKRKISAIDRSEVERLHARIGKENGIYQANRLLERIRSIFNKAIDWGWDGTNPAIGIKKFKEKSRDRFLQPDELPRFFEALANEPNETARDFIMISLLTGARKSNTLAMRWQDISFQAETWRIPDTKNGDAQTIHLPRQAMAILTERKLQSESPWVFPGEGKSGHLADPKKAWARILKEAGIADLRIHDLRRTLGSYQAATGANGYIIGKSLGHRSQQSTAIYARLNLDPVRDSVNKATEAMFGYMQPAREDRK
ncbi:tyrosine-type recombinase/integrase [Paracoccus saliphilus]|uniref:Site-specific recombinase XerD n=1 Tax=Paracoccus saliphilus TaxID=405559 RepID=A0AA46A764_9RHOB|nr:site-specific integrase [Paracoccus saliphilus]WCR02750.1 tyrosine-type recombinase/integrase [Paracoccus saliphilus]SIT08835.1 Site-specific recombinase XerD [Paracoccus saliphilus]